MNKQGAKSALDAERRKKVIEQYQQLGVSKLTLDMWVGPGDRTVKFRERAQAAQGPLDVTIRFFDVNKPVRVQAPPPPPTRWIWSRSSRKPESAWARACLQSPVCLEVVGPAAWLCCLGQGAAAWCGLVEVRQADRVGERQDIRGQEAPDQGFERMQQPLGLRLGQRVP